MRECLKKKERKKIPVLFGAAGGEKMINFKDIRENDLQMEEVLVIYICFGLTKIQSRLRN